MHANEPLDLRSVAGALCLLASAGGATLAWAHMRAIEQMGIICGAPPEVHCGWSASALILGLSGVALVAGAPRLAWRRVPLPATAKPRISGEHV
ncbi:MAG: hypothetical protein Q8Q88_18490 [Phenylobacterium sp.]|uniref:hypothetical protein n=1 Tax=Phenylobacterium sp. TaxID=1871053 RepID=UPI0027358F96|nr:hypothetical protein [Phenylobacterium sp.]MDP3749033.1 hypothetical protein [Phenylobacterium sp.]